MPEPSGKVAITPGAAGTLQNSQCVLDGATSSVVAAGNNLTVNASVSFKPAFIGSKNIYLLATDTKNSLSSAWAPLGTWTLPIPTPAPVSVTPSAGTATSAVFSALYSDTAGANRIGDARLLINNVVSFVGSCGVRYSQAANQLFLMNDAGTVWQGRHHPRCIRHAAEQPVRTRRRNLVGRGRGHQPDGQCQCEL